MEVKMLKHISKLLIVFLLSIFFLLTLFAKEVEVHHWWTSGGEAAALNVLKKDLESKGITWKDSAVAGGAGSEAMTALKARISAGTPPTAVQMLGFDIQDWAKLGYLANLNEVAKQENWAKVVPTALQKFAKYNGVWVSAPVNVHSVNWVWANKAILDEVGVKKLPTSWKTFMNIAKKIQDAGYLPFAHGGQPWQDATVFDSIIYSTGGNRFYINTMIEQNPRSLKSRVMVKVFDRFREFGNMLDDNFSGREWSQTTAMVINGDAAFQVMGDWAKGEFLKAGKKPGADFLCFRFPGTQKAVLFNADQFAMMKVNDSDRAMAQVEMAKSVMDPKFQSAFNVVKGSVPARVDVPNTDFDDCGKKGMKELATASKKGTLQGSMAHGYGGVPAVRNAYFDVVTEFLNNKNMSSKDAANKLAKAIEAAQE